MAATSGRTVTVFGGTGFLGRRIVRHLRDRGFPVRIASRHPDRRHGHFGPDDPQLQSVAADIHDGRSVADALAGAYGVVNAVSLYVEHGEETFHSVHVEAAQRVAAQAHGAGAERLVHVSGIGAETPSTIFELGGPRVYSYEEFLSAVAHQAGVSPVLIPIPFAVWYALAWASEILPNPPLTRNQVELMQVDTVSTPELPGFAELEISPRSVEVMLQEILSSCD